MISKINILVVCSFFIFLFSCNKPDETGIAISNKQLQEYLLNTYDTNNDGVLSKEETLGVTCIMLILDNEPFLDCLEHFPNLEHLALLECAFTSIDVSRNIKLKSLSLQNHRLKYLDLTNNPDLEALDCRNGELQEIRLGVKDKLSSLICDYNKFTELDIIECPQLKILACSSLDKLNVKDNTLLENLYCPGLQSATLDLSNNPFLALLQVNGSMIETLDLSRNSKLETLECCSMPNLTTLDVSTNNTLSILSCVFNPVMTSLYLKTGQTIERLHKDEHIAIMYK